jgi:hypothetical protein
MVGDWRQRRAAKRIKPGTGRALKPLRWWQVPFRALFHLPVPHPDGQRAFRLRYSVLDHAGK